LRTPPVTSTTAAARTSSSAKDGYAFNPVKQHNCFALNLDITNSTACFNTVNRNFNTNFYFNCPRFSGCFYSGCVNNGFCLDFSIANLTNAFNAR
jgi:hypothetical protein